MKRESVKKLRDACSLLAISLVVVSIASLALTGVLSVFEHMTWAVGLFITLKMLVAVLLGGVLGLAIGLLVGRKQVILFSLLALVLVVSIVFVYIRVSDLLTEHTPAMSGAVAPIAESLRHVGFLVGLVAGSHHFIHARGRHISADKSGR
jgi:hypothetical protein